jgi:hypothetical protein
MTRIKTDYGKTMAAMKVLMAAILKLEDGF